MVQGMQKAPTKHHKVTMKSVIGIIYWERIGENYASTILLRRTLAKS
jgi:hypothetical protein